MNSIPTIFNERLINRTVLGGKRNPEKSRMNVSVLLLNSGGIHLRSQNLENLQKCGFKNIISMEKNSSSYNLEDLANKFPTVKFIIPQEEVTDGDLINIGMSETDADYVFVLRDSVQISNFVLSSNIAQKLIEKNCFCYVPRMTLDKLMVVDVDYIPFVEKGVFKVTSTSTVVDGRQTLYPTAFIGLYNRQKFIQLGGYDYTIKSPYWQNLDLSLRSWLWGEKTIVTTGITLSFIESAPVEDTTSNLSQFRFYLKNLAPVFNLDHGELSKSAFFRTLRRTSCGFVETVRQFKDAREWVEKNKYRFKMDAAGLITSWGTEK
ncbi:MAG: hypothetical protein KBT21_03275 [Treponema sp.]|nr:hypothetical protein [Candidatus Treponema merdequi]